MRKSFDAEGRGERAEEPRRRFVLVERADMRCADDVVE
jgi:hypothetical protein